MSSNKNFEYVSYISNTRQSKALYCFDRIKKLSSLKYNGFVDFKTRQSNSCNAQIFLSSIFYSCTVLMNLTTYINRNSRTNSHNLDCVASPILIIIIKQVKNSDKQSQDSDSFEHMANISAVMPQTWHEKSKARKVKKFHKNDTESNSIRSVPILNFHDVHIHITPNRRKLFGMSHSFSIAMKCYDSKRNFLLSDNETVYEDKHFITVSLLNAYVTGTVPYASL